MEGSEPDMTTPIYITPEEAAGEYMRTSRRFLLQAETEFAVGDLIQASEKSWGAAAQALKAAATLRGLEHRNHQALRRVVNVLADETGNPRIRELFRAAEALHANFYETWMKPSQIDVRVSAMREFVGIIANAPPPAGLSVRPIRARRFIRDREDWVE